MGRCVEKRPQCRSLKTTKLQSAEYFCGRVESMKCLRLKSL